MKTSLLLGILIALTLPATLVGRPPEDTAADLAQLAQKMARDLRDRNADAVLDIYGRRAEYVHIENGKEIPFAQLEPAVRSYLESVKTNEIYWVGTPTVLMLGSDAAVVYGTHQFAGAGTREAHRGKWTGVFQRIGGQWKLVHSHSSDEKD